MRARFSKKDTPNKKYDRQVVGRLLSYLKPYVSRMVTALGFAMALNVLRIAQPKFTQYAVDQCIIPGDLIGLKWVALGLAGVLLLTSIFSYVQTLLLESIGLKVTRNLRCQLYEKFQHQDIAYFDQTPIGNMLARLTTDVAALRQLFTQTVTSMISDAVLILAIIAFMLSIDARLTLATLVIVPIMLAATMRFGKRVRHLYDEARTRFARMYALLHEHLSGAKTVQIFNREAESFEKFRSVNDDFYRANIQTTFYEASFAPLTEVIGAVGITFVIWYGGLRIVHNEPLRGILSIGALIAFIQYSQQLLYPIRNLLEKYNALQAAMVASHRIFNTLDLPVSINSSEQPKRGRALGWIEFRGVWFAYKDEEWVLKDVSFVLEPGQMFALVGKTGSGKTTITNLIMRFYNVQRGQILLDGLDVREWDLHELRRNIAIVLQDVFLFSGTLERNFSLGREEISKEHIDSVLNELGLDRLVKNLPASYQTKVREHGGELSVGQKQLISIARALTLDPSVLILDEATSVIDTETEGVIQQAVDRVRRSRTSLVVAHRLSTIQRADRIIVLDQGEVREQGTHQDLLNQRGFYWKLYNSTRLDVLRA